MGQTQTRILYAIYLHGGELAGLLFLTACVVLLLVFVCQKLGRKTVRPSVDSEDRFHLLFEHSTVGMALLSPDGDFVQVNAALLQMLGYRSEELIGKHILDVMYPEDHSSSNRLRGKAHSAHYEREKRFLHRDGHIFWARIVRVPIRDAQAILRYHAFMLIDVSGHKRTEEELREQRRMEEQLGRVRKMETLCTLVGGVAHDFNNQLTAILANLDLLRMDLEQTLAEKTIVERMRPCLQGAELASQRCAHMTARLLTFSRGRLGALQTVALDQLLLEIAAALQHQLPGITLDVQTPPGLPSVIVDVAQMHELLLNLATNAREAMPHGGTLTLSLSQHTFTAEDCSNNLDTRPGLFVELCVRDTGCGMTPEVRERIFEPFFTTKKPGQGQGMGLSVAFGIVKGHKGWIAVDSQLGKGSVFHIYLPAAQTPLPSLETPPLSVLPPPHGERILVVDDEPLIRALAESILERMGYRVISAADGEEALAIYRQEKDHIDLILLDYTMPRMNGVQVLKELQQFDPNVRVLFSSGYHTDHDVDQLMAAGARAFVAKPYRAQELVQSIRRVLAKPDERPIHPSRP